MVIGFSISGKVGGEVPTRACEKQRIWKLRWVTCVDGCLLVAPCPRVVAGVRDMSMWEVRHGHFYGNYSRGVRAH